MKCGLVNELMMTGWLPEVGSVRAYRKAYRSCVRSEFDSRDLGGCEGLFRENTILTIFMSVVWNSWKLPILIKFHQKFQTSEDLTRTSVESPGPEVQTRTSAPDLGDLGHVEAGSRLDLDLPNRS